MLQLIYKLHIIGKMDTLVNSQALTNNNGKSEPTYTALPDMDLLMSLNNNAQDEIKQSVSRREYDKQQFLQSDNIKLTYQYPISPFPKTSTTSTFDISD